ncbi:MAG: hypothetical protein NC929_05360, partial [Candidatus Omnitrophica bacterium]|nr:hypothetical protein [Candidatus Omnitrophota bacterium]
EETIRTIWAKKRAQGKGQGIKKEFAEVLAEIEKTYKACLAEIDSRYREVLEKMKASLNEKEQVFFALDKKAREIFEEEIFTKEGGEIYQRYKNRLIKLKEVYEKANEDLVSAQKTISGERQETALKDIKETRGRAYREYISFKNSLKSRINVVLDEDIEDMRNRLTEMLNNPESETEGGAKNIYILLETYRDGVKRFFEMLTGHFSAYLSPELPAFKKAGKYLNYLSEVLSISKEDNITKIIKELKEKEGHFYPAYIEGKREMEHIILTGLSGQDYKAAEKDYRNALQEYEKEYARYDAELKKAREEYEKNRTMYEEEWQKAREELEKTPEEFKEVYEKLLEVYKKPWMEDHKKVVSLGGLHVIGSERYEARRIDNQLKGRAGRQGDPGSSRFYLSLDDDLLRIFGSERMRSVMAHMPEGEPIAHPLINKMIINAQKKVEARNFEIRKQLIEFDNVLNEQRKVIYTLRQDILEGKKLDTYIEEFIEET